MGSISFLRLNMKHCCIGFGNERSSVAVIGKLLPIRALALTSLNRQNAVSVSRK